MRRLERLGGSEMEDAKETVEDIIAELRDCPVDSSVGSIPAIAAHKLAFRLQRALANEKRD